MSEFVKIPVPAAVNVEISPTLFEDVLQKSQTYWLIIKPRMDLAKMVESMVKDPQAFYTDFYSNKPQTWPDLVALIEKHR